MFVIYKYRNAGAETTCSMARHVIQADLEDIPMKILAFTFLSLFISYFAFADGASGPIDGTFYMSTSGCQDHLPPEVRWAHTPFITIRGTEGVAPSVPVSHMCNADISETIQYNEQKSEVTITNGNIISCSATCSAASHCQVGASSSTIGEDILPQTMTYSLSGDVLDLSFPTPNNSACGTYHEILKRMIPALNP